jgi:hypothetical protein
MLVRNPTAAIRSSVVPYAGTSFLLYWIDMPADSLATSALYFMALFIGFAWMAVAWHRHVLLNEAETPLLRFPATRVAAYLGVATLFTFIIILPVLIIILPVTIAFLADDGGPPSAAYLLAVCITMFLGTVVFGRLGAVLPGVALGPVDNLFLGWSATRGATGAIAVATFVLMVSQYAVSWLTSLLPFVPRAIEALDTVLQWPLAMLGASLLTSTYMHYLQGRSLD